MKRVVVIGGGHGQATIMKALKNLKDVDLCAIVTVADDGGSTGRLRELYNIPAVGDIRNVLVSQYWLVNLSSYKKLENIWDSAIRDGKTVDVDVQVEYNGDDLRPSAFSIEYTVDGEKQEKYITNDFLGGLGL